MTIMNKNHKVRRFVVGVVLAGLITAAATYVPMFTEVAYACMGAGSGC